MTTARNARGIDIVAYREGQERSFVGIQVKSLSRRNPVPLGQSLERIGGDFWVIVVDVATESPTAFVLKPEEIRAAAHRGEKEGRVSYWLHRQHYDLPFYEDK